MLITVLLTTTSSDSSQQSKPDGKKGPQLSVPQVNPLLQWLSESQSPSPNVQGLVIVQQAGSETAFPQVSDPVSVTVTCLFVRLSINHLQVKFPTFSFGLLTGACKVHVPFPPLKICEQYLISSKQQSVPVGNPSSGLQLSCPHTRPDTH